MWHHRLMVRSFTISAVVVAILGSCAGPRSVLRLDPDLSPAPPDTLPLAELSARLLEMEPSFRACGVSREAPAQFYLVVRSGQLTELTVLRGQNLDCVEGALQALPLAPDENLQAVSYTVSIAEDDSLRLSGPLYYGALTKAELYAPVLAARESIQRCGEAERVVGKVTLRWTVQGDGRFAAVRVLDNAGFPRAARCIADLVAEWRSRPPRGGGIVHVSMPFEFETEQDR